VNAPSKQVSPAVLTLSRKEDFKAFCDAPGRIQPPVLSRDELRVLATAERTAYNQCLPARHRRPRRNQPGPPTDGPRLPLLRLAIPFEEVPFRRFAAVYGVVSLPVEW
jgi:hypothetical protein